jgi:succinoglycan biosynthesis transport protein ExoP
VERTDALRALRAGWRYAAAGLLLGLAVAAILNWSAERKYESTTHFFVDVAPTTSEGSDPYGNQQFASQRVISYVQVLTGRELSQGVVDELRLPVSAADLTEMITATPLPDTVVLEVTVTDTSPERAQRIAGSVATQFVSRVQQLETPAGAATPTVTVDVMEPPTFEATPVSPATGRTLALGGALGLLAGLGLALLRGSLDRTVRSDEEAVASGGAEILGRVPAHRQLTLRHISSGADRQPAVAEAFRTMRVNLRHLGRGEHPRVIVVGGSLAGDGASTIAVNLAVSLARAGSRVVLVDADLRRPRVARLLHLSSGRGLTDLLSGDATLQDVVRPWGNTTLTVLDAGPLPTDPGEQLGSPGMRSLLKTLRDEYDYVIVDAPPLLSVVDCAVLSALADGCLIVTRVGHTTRDQLADATSTVRRIQAEVLGIVLNRVPAASRRRRLKGYAADPDRRRGRAPGAATAAPLGTDAVGDSDRSPEMPSELDPDALPKTGNLPPPSPWVRRPAKAWSGSGSGAPGTSPPAAT